MFTLRTGLAVSKQACLLVLVATGVLSWGAGEMLAYVGDRSHGCCKSPKMVIKTVEQGLVAYQTDHTDACPSSLDALYTEKYLTKRPVDHWGAELVFTCPGIHNKNGADIVSKGKDGELGTSDDIKSWDL